MSFQWSDSPAARYCVILTVLQGSDRLCLSKQLNVFCLTIFNLTSLFHVVAREKKDNSNVSDVLQCNALFGSGFTFLV